MMVAKKDLGTRVEQPTHVIPIFIERDVKCSDLSAGRAGNTLEQLDVAFNTGNKLSVGPRFSAAQLD
jgi:hypothetical protein